MMTESQLGKFGLFDTNVPRYTSYPTAPHFGRDVGSQQFTRWVEQISPGSEISLYLHVPFCRRLCWFCACRTQGTQAEAPLLAYLEVLKQELALLRAHLPQGVKLKRLHWGGGTPTLLRAPMLEELAGAIAEILPFTDTYEFSVEIDPNEMDADRLDALASAGLNRASIGVQDFDAEILSASGRMQS
jgi:oxygen-independent coproporphyrinogen-3 oxidase